jgi:hypothetical protein
MLFEYAVEPNAVGSSWSNARYWLEKFGFDRGRLISRFPHKWERKVLEAARAAGMSEVHYKSLVEKLTRAKSTSVVSFSREYDHAIPSWLDNALQQHSLRPFHAIVVSEANKLTDFMLSADTEDDAHRLMVAATNWEVRRVGAELAKTMAPLLQTARRVIFVDPFFDIRESNYRATLKDCLALVSASGNAEVEYEIHYRDSDSRPPAEFVVRNAHTWLTGIIPAGKFIKLFAWKERRGGEDFHDRFLLTDRGGMTIGAGFSADGAHQNAQIALLDPAVWAAKLKALDRSATVYELADPVLAVHSDGRVTRL